MRRLPLLFVSMACLVACSTESESAESAEPSKSTSSTSSEEARPDEQPSKQPVTAVNAVTPDCTWKTPLVPGVPGSSGHLIKSAINPNGVSELANLMRQFVADIESIRPKLEAGQPIPKLYQRHKKMRCSWPTDPSERNEAFDDRAQTYLAAVRAFDAEPNQNNFNAILQGCIACHSVSCQGPIPMIEKHLWK